MKYTKELASEILRRLAAGETLSSICRGDGMPAKSRVIAWALGDHKKAKADGFPEHYARAREIGYLGIGDEIQDIADDARNDWMEQHGQKSEGWKLNGEAVQRSKLRVETRKWILCKMLPKLYGDRIEVDNKSSDGSMTPKPAIDVSKLSDEVMEQILNARTTDE